LGQAFEQKLINWGLQEVIDVRSDIVLFLFIIPLNYPALPALPTALSQQQSNLKKTKKETDTLTNTGNDGAVLNK